jgi:cold shock CspA family protein
MPFLSEKEAIETWTNSELFTSVLPKDATAHSFDYIRRMVAESKKKAQQAEAKKAALLEQQQEEQERLLELENNDNEDDQHQKQQQQRSDDQEKEKLVFELATADEATLELFAQEVAEEEEETIRKQKALNEGDQEDGPEKRGDNDGPDAPENDANTSEQKKKKTNNIKSGPPSAVASPTTKNENSDQFPNNNNNIQSDLSTRRQNQQVDIEVITEAFGFKPNTHERYRGRIKTFLGDHGYGFIQPYAGAEFAERRKLQEEEFHRKQMIKIQQMKKNQDDADDAEEDDEVKEIDEENNKQDSAAADGGGELPSSTKKKNKSGEQEQEDEELELAPLPFNPLAIEIFISVEDVLTLGAASAMMLMTNGGGMHQQHRRGRNNINQNNNNNMINAVNHQDPQFRALRIPLPGEEVEFSVVIAQTHHGRSLRAVRLTGPNGSPLVIQTSSMRQRGIVRLWDTQRKFGFITPLTNGPPPGLASLEEGRLLPETVQALKKKQSGDVFTLSTNVIWDLNAAPTQNERTIVVGSIVEYTAVLRKFQQQNNNNSNNKQDDANSKENNRLVAICVTDVGYRPLDPNILERTVGIENLNQVLSSAGIGGSGGTGATSNRHRQQQKNNNDDHGKSSSQQIDLATLIANGTIVTARPDVSGNASFNNNNNQFGGMMMMGGGGSNMNVVGNPFGTNDLFHQQDGDNNSNNNNNTKDGVSGINNNNSSANNNNTNSVADLFGGNMTW